MSSSSALNYILAFAHGIQAILYTILATLPQFSAATIPIFYTKPLGRPGSQNLTFETTIFTYSHPVAMVATFMYITSIFHIIRACMPNIKVTNGKNKDTSLNADRMWRWVEYSITSTIMIVVILLTSGVCDIYTLVGFSTANVAMILFGASGDFAIGSNKYYTFLFGCITSLPVWGCIFAQVSLIALSTGASNIPFVLSISVVLFVLFQGFAVAEYFYIRSYGLEGNDKNDKAYAESSRYWSEFSYQLLSAISKTTLSALVAAAMLTLN